MLLAFSRPLRLLWLRPEQRDAARAAGMVLAASRAPDTQMPLLAVAPQNNKIALVHAGPSHQAATAKVPADKLESKHLVVERDVGK